MKGLTLDLSHLYAGQTPRHVAGHETKSSTSVGVCPCGVCLTCFPHVSAFKPVCGSSKTCCQPFGLAAWLLFFNGNLFFKRGVLYGTSGVKMLAKHVHNRPEIPKPLVRRKMAE